MTTTTSSETRGVKGASIDTEVFSSSIAPGTGQLGNHRAPIRRQCPNETISLRGHKQIGQRHEPFADHLLIQGGMCPHTTPVSLIQTSPARYLFVKREGTGREISIQQIIVFLLWRMPVNGIPCKGIRMYVPYVAEAIRVRVVDIQRIVRIVNRKGQEEHFLSCILQIMEAIVRIVSNHKQVMFRVLNLTLHS